MVQQAHIPKAGKRGNPAFKTSGNGYRDCENRTERTLSEDAKIRRRMFVSHYIKTTNATASADFAGFKSPNIKGVQLLREPFVQNLIQEALNKLELDAIMTQQEILFRFKEEANNQDAGNQNARIAALAHIAKIQGMMIERQELTVSSGVMVVPVMQPPEEWEELAAKAQDRLKQKVKD